MFSKRLIILTICCVMSFEALSWGQIGHRVTGAIAEKYLSPEASQRVQALFPEHSLAEISTFADEERSNPATFWQKTAGPWHYVTVPVGRSYIDLIAPKVGDASTALVQFSRTLSDSEASLKDKQRALHFIVHIIGDLHQPLHAGNGTDRGGNDRKVVFFWEDSNLHRVWDSGMIDKQQLSYTEWTDWLSRKIDESDISAWHQTEPSVWIKESTTLRDGLYPEEDNISWQYQYQHLPTVKKRLQQAGVRIALYLNEVFASEAK